MKTAPTPEVRVCVDASLVAKWLIDEDDSPLALDVLERWIQQSTDMVAPILIDYEMGSVLRKVAARGLISADEARERLHLLEVLPIRRLHPPFLLQRAWAIATRYGLYTIYDASYAALAEHLGVRLYTCDKAFISALGGESDMIVNPVG